MSDLKHSWLWLDLETTGLDPHADLILECAVVLADDAVGGTFESVEEFSAVIHRGEGTESALARMDDYVRNMHTKSGLLDEVRAAARGEHSQAATCEEMDDFLVELVKERLGAKPRSVVLAGFSVHFDLGFVRVHFPKFAAFCSHRVMDVSALKAFERVHGAEFVATESQARPHRALEDVRVSLEEARRLRDRRWA